MKITKFTLYKVQPRWLFLKIDTDQGLSGWGEPIVEGRADAVRAAVEEFEKYLIGKDPMRIEDHWQVMYRSGFYRGGPETMSAIAGIDQALWDINVKDHGEKKHRQQVKRFAFDFSPKQPTKHQEASDIHKQLEEKFLVGDQV